jgi:hypothetical protein
MTEQVSSAENQITSDKHFKLHKKQESQWLKWAPNQQNAN